MKTCIFLNGSIYDYEDIKQKIESENYDNIICADGGANHVYKMGLTPGYIIGDLDSVDPQIVEYYKEKGVEFKKFPEKKDETDSELCIILAEMLGSKEVDLYAALGGRIDHTLANVKLLDYMRRKGITPRIITEDEILYLVHNGSLNVKGNKGDTLSVIPIRGDAAGITLYNLEYPLNNFTMDYAQPIGISNVMLGDECTVEVKNGSAIVVRNLKEV